MALRRGYQGKISPGANPLAGSADPTRNLSGYSCSRRNPGRMSAVPPSCGVRGALGIRILHPRPVTSASASHGSGLAATPSIGTSTARFRRNGSAMRQRVHVDAFHIAVTAAHQVDYLLTWNCRHLANAAMRGTIEAVCRANGLTSPIICTPEELPAGGSYEAP